MSWLDRPLGRVGFARWLTPAILVLILVFFAPAGWAGSSHSVGAPRAVHPIALAHPSAVPAAPTPFVGPTFNGTFYTANPLPQGTSTNAHCTLYYGWNYCDSQEQEPSALHLKNGTIGVGFSIVTNKTANTCFNATNTTVVRVGFSISTTNGTSYGPITYLGNNTCPYIQALEPSFAVSSTGEIFGTFIEANATPTQMQTYGFSSPVTDYTTRSSDALAFVTSVDNGSTFSKVRTLTLAGAANLARPALASIGRTVYIVYENNSNTTSTLPGSSSYGISLDLVYSSDAGATWHGPYNVPGVGASESYTAMSPSISVNSAGKVAIAYATNRHCLASCFFTFGSTYGDDIVVSTSTSNGTSFIGPNVVARNTGAGESLYAQGFYVYSGGPSLFESTPVTSIAWGPTGGALYVAWAGATNRSLTSNTYEDWYSATMYAAVSSNGGASWQNTSVGFAPSNDPNAYYASSFDPGLAVSPGGTVYLTYTYYNDAYSSCSPVHTWWTPGFSQWTATSLDGLNWSGSVLTSESLNVYSGPYYTGFESSITFSTAGNPVVVYPNPMPEVYTGLGDSIPVELNSATVYTGGTTQLTVIENNLTGSSTWSAGVQGNTFTTSATSLRVWNVPLGIPVIVQPAGASGAGIPLGYRTVEFPAESGAGVTTLTGPTTYWFNFSTFYGISFNINPLDLNYFEVYAFNNSLGLNFYHQWSSYSGFLYQYGCPFPWYFPRGQSMTTLSGYNSASAGGYYYGSLPAAYWNGTGSGSYTGPGATGTMVVSSPWNETVWPQAYGLYNVTVQPIGLPSSSSYSFQWDGVTYTGTGTHPVVVHGAGTGVHWITHATATAGPSGWEYIGTMANSGEVQVPLEPLVNLTFAYVDVGGSTGVVKFHASGLTQGTIWHYGFNGTEYASSTPWINITTHSGNFSEVGYPVTAANGSATYAPLSLNPWVNVTTGSTYTVSYGPAYELSVYASNGGHVVPSTSSYWVAPGTLQSLSAVASPGYRWVSWSGTGAGAVNGNATNITVTVNGPIVETANFAPLVPNRFNLTFLDQGSIPNGTWWTVYLNGVGYSSNSSTLVVPNLYSCGVSGSLGRYTLSVPYAYTNGTTSQTRYVPSTYPGQVCGGTVQPLSFKAQFALTLESTFGGTVSATSGTASSTSSLWLSASASVTLQATANAPYAFLGWNGTGIGSYTGTSASPTFSIGGPVSEVGAFGIPPPAVVPRYTLTVHELSTLATGTAWSVTVQGAVYSSTATTLNITGLIAGTYSFSVGSARSTDGLNLYTPNTFLSHLSISADTNQSVSYRTSYWVAISTVGPGTAIPSNEWVLAGNSIVLNATPTAPDVFASWTGTGAGSYTGTSPVERVTVTGPISEVATFVPPAPAAKVVASGTWSSPALWAGLAVAGVVVGFAVGLVIARMRKPPTTGGSA